MRNIQSKHLTAAKSYALTAASKFALAGMFSGFSGHLAEIYAHIAIYGGGGILVFTDILPTLKAKLSEEDSESKLLTAIHYLKKPVAFVELLAVGGVYAEQTLEIKEQKDEVETLKGMLIPSFAVLLAAKGTLEFLRSTQKIVRDGLNLEKGAVLITGPGGTLAQAGTIICSLIGAMNGQMVNTVNAALSLGQSAIASGFGLWHRCKASRAAESEFLFEPLTGNTTLTINS